MAASKRHQVAFIPGDGIGPEVIAEATKVLEAAALRGNFEIEGEFLDLGAERFLRTGEVLPDSVMAHIQNFDAVLLGAVGDPRVPPGVLEGGLLLRLRQDLDLYVNLRPAKLFKGVTAPHNETSDFDVVIVRENTEGLYCRRGSSEKTGTSQETALELSLNTAPAVERLLRFAFEFAAKNERELTLVHKLNVLEHAGNLYRRLFLALAEEYPQVKTDYQHVDAAALLLVQDPKRFSVIATDNLFGDILSDLTAALVGGIGLVGSGNIHPGRVSIFEPVHGSAPDIAGTGKANPIGAILSSALMLRHLGETKAAERVEHAVAESAAKAERDQLTCTQIGDLVALAAG
ncbi:MAG: 3-isopropylmalate dehydrogenase [Actinomycetota bacterium]